MVDVWPNPAMDVLNIERTLSSGKLNISVSDMSGKLIPNFTQTGTRERIDVSVWPSGIYILQGSDEKGRSFSVKVMKTSQ